MRYILLSYIRHTPPSKEIEPNEGGKKVIKTEQCINAIDTSLPHLRQQQNTPSLTHLVPVRLRIRQMNLIAETQPPFNRAILRPKIAEPNLPRARLHRSPIKRSRKEPHRGQEGEGEREARKWRQCFPSYAKLATSCLSVVDPWNQEADAARGKGVKKR